MRSKYSKDRRDKIRTSTNLLNRSLKRLGAKLYFELSQLLTSLKTDADGKIRFITSNVKKGESVSLIIRRFNRENADELKDLLIKRFLEILGLNKLYFKEIDTTADTVAEKTETLIMRRLGYNVKTKELIKDGYIENLANSTQLASNLATIINRAISGTVSLKDFQQQVQGLISAQRAFDIFQQVDRQASLLYAEELKLKYAIWNNSPKKTTTDFCRDRAGNVYSREEIEAWDNGEWKGKFEFNHRTIIDGHGYGCRTSIDFISEKLAFRLRPDLKPQE